MSLNAFFSFSDPFSSTGSEKSGKIGAFYEGEVLAESHSNFFTNDALMYCLN